MTNEQAPATHRKLSGEQLNEALINSGDHEAERYSQACALTGIGYALLVSRPKLARRLMRGLRGAFVAWIREERRRARCG